MTTIFVGNLAYSTTEQELHRAFSSFGKVARVDLMRVLDSGLSRGFAYVKMPNTTDAEQAIVGLNGQELDDRILSVYEFRPLPDDPETGRKEP